MCVEHCYRLKKFVSLSHNICVEHKTKSNMKRFKLFALIFSALTLSLVSCQKNEEPKPVPEPEQQGLKFETTISGVSKTSVDVTVTPSDLEAEYVLLVMDKELADEFTKDEYLVATIYQDFADDAAKQGKLLAEYMAEIVDKGVLETTFKGLATGTDYYVLLFGVDAANGYEQCSDLYRLEFRTLDVEYSEAGFNVTTQVENNNVKFSITPEDDTMRWHLFSVTRALLEQYTDPNGDYGWSNEYFFSMYFQDEINQLLGAGYTEQQVIDALIFEGALELEAKGLNANTEYAYLISGLQLDSDGLFIITDATTGYYTTGDAQMTDLTFDIKVTDVQQMKASFTITPSNNNEVYCALVDVWDGVSDANTVMHQIVDQWGGWMSIMANDKGVVNHNNFSLPAADTDYYVIAFGYSGGITSDACMATFRSLPGGKAEDCVFEMSGNNATPYGFDLKVESSDPTIYYSPGVCTPEQFNEAEFIAMEEEIFQYYYEGTLDFDPSATKAEVFDQYYYNGNSNLVVSGVAANTEFMGYLFVFDITTGKVIRTVTFDSVVRTEPLGSITPTIELVGYYSGDEEAGSIFGEPAATSGKAITVVKYDNFDGARTLYTTMVGDDCTNQSMYSDPELWGLTSGLWSKCKVNEPYTFYVAEWEYLQTALCYAIDASGNPGGIARLLTMASAEEKSPIDELRDLYISLTASTSSVLPTKSMVVASEPSFATAWRPELKAINSCKPCVISTAEEPCQVKCKELHVDSDAFIPRFILR